MFGHNNFDYALQTVFMGEVTKTKPVKWTDGDWGDGQDPNWATDTRSWTYNGYTITQESKKQEHNVVDEKLWYKYKTITTATDASGVVIHSITGDTITYDIDTLKNIDPDRNKQGNDMQDFLDTYQAVTNGNGNGNDNGDDNGDNGDDNGEGESGMGLATIGIVSVMAVIGLITFLK